MFEDIYPFKAANFYKFFTFNSIGPERVVVKVVQFTRVEENLYNLGLADFEYGKLQFTETSNNQDIVKVIGTVATIVRGFTEKYPEREVLIQGEIRRMKLYNLVFQRRWNEIEPEFYVWGLEENDWYPYISGKVYDAIKIKRKTLTARL